jgi:hypothetical protein
LNGQASQLAQKIADVGSGCYRESSALLSALEFFGKSQQAEIKSIRCETGERRQQLGQAKPEKDERNPRELPKEAFLPTSWSGEARSHARSKRVPTMEEVFSRDILVIRGPHRAAATKN